MSDNKQTIDEVSGVPTTGHEWDGIRELDNPMPRWWLWVFYATIAFAALWMLLYPSVPLVTRAWPGLLHYSSRIAVENKMAAIAASRAPLDQKIAAQPLAATMADPKLVDYAVRGGASAFKVNCVQCHGSGAEGSQTYGYPNLNDDDWLWGGTPEQILATITHGARDAADPAGHNSMMPAFGAQGILTPIQISAVADYVWSLSGHEGDPVLDKQGRQIFAQNCAACHGPDGKGNHEIGAPNLTDAIWLYGSGKDAIARQVTNPRMGTMPAWGVKLDQATLKKLAIFVHNLGGGK